MEKHTHTNVYIRMASSEVSRKLRCGSLRVNQMVTQTPSDEKHASGSGGTVNTSLSVFVIGIAQLMQIFTPAITFQQLTK